MFRFVSRLGAAAVFALALNPLSSLAVTAQDCGSGSMKCDDIQVHRYLFTPTAPGCGVNTPEMPSIPPRPPGTFAPWPSKGFYDELSAALYVQDSYRCSTYAAGMCEDHGTQARSEYTIWSSWQGGIAATENRDYVWAAKFWAGDPPTCSSYQEFPFIMQRRT